jgi:hypothetical protein
VRGVAVSRRAQRAAAQRFRHLTLLLIRQALALHTHHTGGERFEDRLWRELSESGRFGSLLRCVRIAVAVRAAFLEDREAVLGADASRCCGAWLLRLDRRTLCPDHEIDEPRKTAAATKRVVIG